MKQRGLIAICISVMTGFAAFPALADGDVDGQSVADAIVRGFAAEASDDGPGLLGAARDLVRLGAHPEGGADLARQWRREAKKLGAQDDGDEDIWRGRTLGPAYKSGRIGAHGHFRTRQSFNAGLRAEIVLVPLSEAPLALSVSDDDGAAICEVAPSTRNLGCRWVPTFTGTSSIEVENENDQSVDFYIVLN